MADLDYLAMKQRIQQSTLRGLERYTARCILDYWSKESPTPWPSETELVEWSGFSKNAVIKAIKGLVAAGAVRIQCKRPMKKVNGRLEVVRNAKPTNHYDLSGLMTLPVRERYRCTSDTSARGAPVHEGTRTSARGAPEPVHERDTNVSKNKSMKRSTNIEFALEPPTPKQIDPIVEVFEFWQQNTGHTRSKLDKKRRERIQARLKEGFSTEELKQAIEHRKNDPWLMGEIPGSRLFDRIETLLRDADQVERLRDLTKPQAATPLRATGGYAPQDDGSDQFAGHELRRKANP